MKLAYVEDDPDAQKLFARKFSAEGAQCDVFAAGEELLKLVSPGSYDLLLIDIRLPGCNGVELLKELRQRGVFTPAVIITAFNSVEYAREALNSGANYLLEKPFSFASLRRIIEKVLGSPSSLHECVDRGLASLGLSRRQEETARLILKGLSNKETAQVVGISEKTVKQYITQIFGKAKVASRGEFFAYIFPI